ncbi:MAG: hypothetical protein A3C04_01700 [Candidatus Wildermuthbacteria bacterium RIFCSPHIGHO2_02_FULL_45_25]|uniref:cysteine desulfurase n=1 Tax=Candidatus Wildermuthbacteria bacterium RIFCSPHIGHO2_02_FULL_45_25 TaxID=1802450 RepID=A0A1G2R3C2_9BACT|nr:MAG: hypothetical protein A3C04_01700 [Candidatus Wildermuthbacteria bacterium RIFCSPHIGHO2_02_FULL_45_25]
MKTQKRIYLDYAASAPLDKKALEAMMPYLTREFGNPSSLHSFGQEARAAIEHAREQLARFLHCKAAEIIFTGGATEANNLVIKGVLEHAKSNTDTLPHIVVSGMEHESVLEPAEHLRKQGLAEVAYVKPGKDGIMRVKDIEKALQKNTVLVSVMYANSEIGTIQPIKEIAEAIRNAELAFGRRVFFHTDAVQAANYLSCDVEKLDVDLLTLSSHKIYGPKGIGALYVREGVSLSAVIEGGGQEFQMRSGTEHVAGIVGFGAAVQQINPKSHDRIKKLRDNLLVAIQQSVPDTVVTGSLEKRLPNNLHVRFKGVEGRDVVMRLDQAGFAVSTGSACSEKTQEPSHVLISLGIQPKDALSSVRVSLGKSTTQKDIQAFARALSLQVAALGEKGL